MSTATTEYHDCAVCENKTQLRCDACREVYFCSRECQRMIWSTHKWTCGKLALPFSFPPLTPVELADLERLKNETFTRNSSGARNFLQALSFSGAFSGSWARLLDTLSSTYPATSSSMRTLLLSFAHQFLYIHRDKASSLSSPWRMCAALYIHALAHLGSFTRTLEQITPFLHQYLVHRSIVKHLNRRPPVERNAHDTNLLLLSINRASDVLRTLRVDDGPGTALRTYWAEVTAQAETAFKVYRMSSTASAE